MKLKYNLIAWSLLGFFAAACDPMDDIYNEIDAEGTTNTQTMAEYVLTDADYEMSVFIRIFHFGSRANIA